MCSTLPPTGGSTASGFERSPAIDHVCQLPDRAAEVLGALRWRFQRGPIPPGLRSYTRAPWLVANDRLKAQGWSPTVTNEQAYVEGTEGRWWTMITPKRRQEIALGGMVLGSLVAIAGIVAGVRRWRGRQ